MARPSRSCAALRWRCECESALRRVATGVAELATLSSLLDLVAREVGHLLQARHGAVVHTAAGSVDVVAASGRGGAELDQTLRRRDDPHVASAPIRCEGHDGPVWGAVVAVRAQLQPPAACEQLLAEFAELVGTALRNDRRRRELAARARRDPLTALCNRRGLLAALDGELERARRHERSLSIVLIDLDGFKPVNDSLGHAAGDAVLVKLAELLTRHLRRGELLARIGGDEFGLLLPESSIHQARAAGARLQQTLRENVEMHALGLTLSIGAAEWHAGLSRDELLKLGDDALYAAKRAGGDRVLCAGLDHQPGAAAPSIDQAHALAGVRALARAVDAKDPSTQRHSERVADLSAALAEQAGWQPSAVEDLRQAALIHDVGKIVVPTAVLLKPGPLSEAEYAHVQQHPAIGAQIAAEILREDQVQWIRSHHERIDGAGYPDGLVDGAITPGARLLALADAWDAMTTPRPYREALSYEVALARCEAQAGRQFCATAVRLLADLVGEAQTVQASPRELAEPGPVAEGGADGALLWTARAQVALESAFAVLYRETDPGEADRSRFALARLQRTAAYVARAAASLPAAGPAG